MKRPVLVVRLLIPDERNRVLLLQRANTSHSPDYWNLPGGKVDVEPLEKAISRELLQETGMACTCFKFLFYLETPPNRFLDLYFEVGAIGKIVLNNEHRRFAWIGPRELGQYAIAFQNDLGILRYWRIRGLG